MAPDGGVYIFVDDDHTMRVPEGYVKEVFEWGGHKFAVHPEFSFGKAVAVPNDERSVITELQTGARIQTIPNGMGNPKDVAIDFLEAKGGTKLKEVISKYIENKLGGKRAWELPSKYSSDDVVFDKNDQMTLRRVTESILTATGWGTSSIPDIERWIKEYADDDFLVGVAVERQDANEWADSYETWETAIYGWGSDPEPMDLYEAESVATALQEIQDALGKNSVDADFNEIASWAERNDVDLNSFAMHNYGFYGDIIEMSADEIIARAFEQDMSPIEVNEELEAQEEEGSVSEQEALADDVEVGGKYYDASILRGIGGWVIGGVAASRRYIFKRDIATLPEELKSRFTADAYWREPSEDEDIGEALIQASVDVTDPVLWRGVNSNEWLKAVPGDVIPNGVCSFTRSQHMANQFGKVTLELRTPPPLQGVPVEDIVREYPDAANAFRIDAYHDEREIIVRAPFLKVVGVDPDTSTLKVEAFYDVASLVEMSKSGSDLMDFDDGNVPVVLRDDPKFYAKLSRSLNGHISDRSPERIK